MDGSACLHLSVRPKFSLCITHTCLPCHIATRLPLAHRRTSNWQTSSRLPVGNFQHCRKQLAIPQTPNDGVIYRKHTRIWHICSCLSGRTANQGRRATPASFLSASPLRSLDRRTGRQQRRDRGETICRGSSGGATHRATNPRWPWRRHALRRLQARGRSTSPVPTARYRRFSSLFLAQKRTD